MNKAGKLSKRDIQTLDRAWEILSRWTEVAEERGDDGRAYEDAMTAVCGLCDFLHEVKTI